MNKAQNRKPGERTIYESLIILARSKYSTCMIESVFWVGNSRISDLHACILNLTSKSQITI